MKNIISDYRKSLWTLPLRWWIVTLIETAVYFFTGVFSGGGTGQILAIVCASIFAVVSLYITLDVLVFAALRFKKRLNTIPENERLALLEQYKKAPELGKRHFLDEYLICFSGMNITLVKFSEIRSAELKGFKLLLDTGGNKPLKMPFGTDENPAILVAAMRSRNPNISVILNGKIVEKMENGKEKP